MLLLAITACIAPERMSAAEDKNPIDPAKPYTGTARAYTRPDWEEGVLGQNSQLCPECRFIRTTVPLIDGRKLQLVLGALNNNSTNADRKGLKPPGACDSGGEISLRQVLDTSDKSKPSATLQLDAGFMHVRILPGGGPDAVRGGPNRLQDVVAIPWRLILASKTRAAAAVGTEFILVHATSLRSDNEVRTCEEIVIRPGEQASTVRVQVARIDGDVTRMEGDRGRYVTSKAAGAPTLDEAHDEFAKAARAFADEAMRVIVVRPFHPSEAATATADAPDQEQDDPPAAHPGAVEGH